MLILYSKFTRIKKQKKEQIKHITRIMENLPQFQLSIK